MVVNRFIRLVSTDIIMEALLTPQFDIPSKAPTPELILIQGKSMTSFVVPQILLLMIAHRYEES
jgi:hypothetical protein